MKNRTWKPYIVVAANTMGSGEKPMILDLCVAGVKIFTDPARKNGRLRNAYNILKSHTAYAAWDQRTNLANDRLSDKISVDKWMVSPESTARFTDLTELAQTRYPAPDKFYETIRTNLKAFYRTVVEYESIPVVALDPFELRAINSLERGMKMPLWDSTQERCGRLLWEMKIPEIETPSQIPSDDRVESLCKMLYLSHQL